MFSSIEVLSVILLQILLEKRRDVFGTAVCTVQDYYVANSLRVPHCGNLFRIRMSKRRTTLNFEVATNSTKLTASNKYFLFNLQRIISRIPLNSFHVRAPSIDNNRSNNLCTRLQSQTRISPWWQQEKIAEFFDHIATWWLCCVDGTRFMFLQPTSLPSTTCSACMQADVSNQRKFCVCW